MTYRIKRSVFLALVPILVLLAPSCNASTDKDPFSAFSGEIRAQVKLTVGESASIYEYRRENGTETVAFSAPNELCGYVFTKKDDDLTLSYGDLTAKVSPSVGRIALISSEIFSPSASDISSVSALELDGEYITEVTLRNVIYRFSHDGTPISISGTVLGTDFSAEMISLGGAL